MNTLSWLLYGADVAESLRGISVTIMIGGAVAAFFGAVFAPLLLSDGLLDFDAKPFLRSAFKTIAISVPLAALFFVVAPSKNTIMLIAASEVGETVLASEQAQTIGGEAGALATDSLRVLRKFINEQLEDEAE